MKKITILTLTLFCCLAAKAQPVVDKEKVTQDLNELIKGLEENYVYLNDKKVDIRCIRDYYGRQVNTVKTRDDVVLLFEYLLCEFYDSHLILNTNIQASYRLYAPIYVQLQNNKFIISNVWQSQISGFTKEIIGAEVLTINGTDFNKAIQEFPTHCNDKNSPAVSEWIANKLLAGNYNRPRIVGLKLKDAGTLKLNLDSLILKKEQKTVTTAVNDRIGVIRINNSLGNNKLVQDFDQALDSLMDTQGLIIDLRNTVDGGDSYVARGIMSRFITEAKPYQKHVVPEKFDDGPMIERSWIEYVSPRGNPYKKPLIVLVGRWTGSMGEGLAIGFEGIERGVVVGTEMERLAGEMEGFRFRNQNFGYRISIAKLLHVNGTPREVYVPVHYVRETTNTKDEALERALKLLTQKTKQ
jgi:carboxyl-terminal processing protease